MKEKIAIIDDDPDLIDILTDLLQDEGYNVRSNTNPLEGRNDLVKNPPDLLLLDVRMKEMSGLDLCKKIKSDPRTQSILVIVMSVKSDEADVVVGLELGADDYISKPIRKAELLARVRTVLRRKGSQEEPEKLVRGPLQIDLLTYSATVNGRPLKLSPKEFELLTFLARREGHVLTRTTISNKVWGHEHFPNSNTIDFYMHQLRKKLGSHQSWIQGLRGVGYRFEVD